MREGARRGFALAGLVFLGGCVSVSRENQQPMHTYLLNPEPAAVESVLAVPKPPVGVLLIAVPQAQPGFDSPRMAYAQRPFEVHYYSANQWADAPTRLLAPLLVRMAEQRGVARTVVALPSSVRGDVRLDIDQLALVQEFWQPPSRVRGAFRAQLVKLPEQIVLGSRQFEATESAPSDDAYGGATAANRVVAALLEHVSNWALGCLKGSSAPCASSMQP